MLCTAVVQVCCAHTSLAVAAHLVWHAVPLSGDSKCHPRRTCRSTHAAAGNAGTSSTFHRAASCSSTCAKSMALVASNGAVGDPACTDRKPGPANVHPRVRRNLGPCMGPTDNGFECRRQECRVCFCFNIVYNDTHTYNRTRAPQPGSNDCGQEQPHHHIPHLLSPYVCGAAILPWPVGFDRTVAPHWTSCDRCGTRGPLCLAGRK